MVDNNKKVPKSALDENDIEPKYGYVHGEWDALGGHHLTYRNPEEHEKSYSESITPSGSYHITHHDKKKKEIHTSVNPGEHRGYVGGGKSVQVDGHFDHNGEGTGRMEHAADFGQSTGKNYYRGTSKKEFKMSGDSRYSGTQQGSKAVYCRADSGTNRHRVKGDRFEATEGDYVSMGEKKKIEVFQKDVSMYAGSNHDVFIKEKGKIETGSTIMVQTGSTATVNSASSVMIKAAQEITLDGGSKITIKVGGSSIVIQSGTITIKSASIKFEQG
jgi:hypothetical protein